MSDTKPLVEPEIDKDIDKDLYELAEDLYVLSEAIKMPDFSSKKNKLYVDLVSKRDELSTQRARYQTFISHRTLNYISQQN